MRKAVVLTGVGRDRIGIVAELTQALYEAGCNLLDSSMTLLRGEFALIVMAELPDSGSISELEKNLAELEKQLGMAIHIREMTPDELQEPQSEPNAFIVSVYGADKPGIVARVTKALAAANMNITDVQTKSTTGAQHIFVMILEVNAPADSDVARVEKLLRQIGQDLDVDISVQSLDVVEL